MPIQPELAKTPTLSTAEIVDEFEARKRRFADRDAWYERLLNYYNGQSKSEGGLPILAANSQGRPLLRPVGESINARRTYSSQRLAPVVDDYSALLGRMPTARVEPPDPSPQGEARAELLTKYLYSTYELSRLGYQQAQAGFLLSALGDTVYVLEPEPTKLRVVWSVFSPKNCWPSFYHGYRRFEVFDLLVAEVWTASELRKQWGVLPPNDKPESCTVLTYLSPYQRSVIVGTKNSQRVAHVEWDLDFCPAVWVFNKVTGMMGMSDIGNSLDQQDFLDWCFNVAADGIVQNTYPLIGVKDPINVGQDQITIGPGAPPIPLQGTGDIIVRQTQGDMRAIEMMMAQTLQDINAATGSSQVRQEGQMKSSIVTGRAVQSVQGPQSTRIEFKQQVLGDAIEAANSFTLAMQEKAPFLKDFKGPIFGNLKGKSFQEEFSAKDDIDGWYRTKVSWQSLVGMNLQQKTAVAYEGMVAGIWDDLEARDIVGIEDPLGMRKRVQSLKLQEAQLQQQLEGGQGQPGQPAPAQAQQGQQAAPAQAQAGQQQVPPELQPAPLRFKPFGAVQTPARPDQKKLEAALKQIADKLKGTVWTAGVEILISDYRDYTKVQKALEQVAPGIKIRAVPEDKMPEFAERVV